MADALEKARALAKKLAGAARAAAPAASQKIYVRRTPGVDFDALVDGAGIQKRSRCEVVLRGDGSRAGGEDPMHVVVSGPDEDAVRDGVRMVRDVLFESQNKASSMGVDVDRGGGGDSKRQRLMLTGANADETERSLDIPASAAATVIGHRGETVQKLQRDTGCHISVGKELFGNDLGGERLRKITVRGASVAAVEAALDAVTLAIQGGSNRAASADRQVTISFEIAGSRAGAVIGKRGAVVKEIMDRTHTHVSLPPSAVGADPENRIVTVTGDDAAAVEAAKREVLRLCESSSGPPGGVKEVTARPGEHAVPYTVPDSKAGLLIGRGGNTVNSLQTRNHVRIRIPQQCDVGTESNPTRTIQVFGKIADVSAAIREMEKLVTGQMFTEQDGTISAPIERESNAKEVDESGDHTAAWERYFEKRKNSPAVYSETQWQTWKAYFLKKNLGELGPQNDGGLFVLKKHLAEKAAAAK